MNKLEDFTEGSEWVTVTRKRLQFRSIHQDKQIPMFTTKEKRHVYISDENGLIGFKEMWKHFTKLEPSND